MKIFRKKNWASLIALGFVATGLSVMLMGAYRGELLTINPFIESLHRKLGDYNSYKPEDRVYLHIDRPQYKPGEDIWFSAYVRDGRTLRKSEKSEVVKVELINPKGTVEKALNLIADNGIAAGDFHLDESAAGGLYKIKAYTQWQQNDEPMLAFEKDITVQAVVMPNLKMKLDFERKAYGAGDKVSANLNLQTNSNEPLAHHDFTFKASLAGGEIISGKSSTDAAGEALVSFQLPAEVSTHDGLLNVMISYDGLTESVSRSIPIVLNTVGMQLLPEGGDMVAGLRTRVAFRAVNEFGKPADVQGVVTDPHGLVVGNFSSYHDGMGAFEFTPQAGVCYTAKITRPEGVKNTFILPEALPRGFVLNVDNVKEDAIHLSVRSTEQEAVSLIAQVRGEIYYAAEIAVKPGDNAISIPTAAFPVGVAQVSLFDSKGVGRAERLTFVNRHKKLSVDITTDKEKYLPREKVTMTLRVKDERGMPMPADLSLAVTDDQLLAFADDKQGNLLSMMLLQYDLKEKIEEARFYFDPKEEKAAMATEYLLMTSGWRRFKWDDIITNLRPPLKYYGERTEVSGLIIDSETGNPLKSAKVKTEDGKSVTYTDETGRFSFRGLDITEPVSLQVEAKGFETNSIYVSAYSDAYSAYMYKPYDRRMMMFGAMAGKAMEAGDIPMAAPMELDMVEVEDATREEMVVEKPGKLGLADNTEAKKDPAGQGLADDHLELAKLPEQKEKVGARDQANKVVVADSIVAFVNGGTVFDMDKNIVDFEGGEMLPQATYHRARQFAAPIYESATSTQPIQRTDFRSTVYWNPRVKVDRTGKAIVNFYNNDAISSFRATAEGFGTEGTPGRGEAVFFTQMPFSMTGRLPVEVVAEDVINIPVVLKNNTSSTLKGSLHVNVPQGFEGLVGFDPEMTLAAGETRTLFLAYKVQPGACPGRLSLDFTGGGQTDKVSQELKVVPRGFPVALAISGNELEKEFAFEVTNLVTKSMQASVIAYPTILSDLMKGVESILQEPYGCFEQTSSSNYPNVMVMHHLKQEENPDPKLMNRTKDLLDKGYKRLVSFETKEKGYEWFGGNPGHEALTAYGLLEFHDMQDVYSGVDKAMVDRTAAWLMARKDGNGGFRRNPAAIDQFGSADEDITNAYIVYSLAEAGYKDIQKELTAVYENARKTKDPYVMGLVANAMYSYGDATRGKVITDMLASAQQADGGFKGTRHSITRSGGISLDVETTSLAVMALMHAGRMDNVQKGVKFLVAQRSGQGGFGSTQGTILALKALTRFAEASRRAPEGGTIEVYVDGAKVTEKAYEAGEANPIEVLGLEQYLSEGKHSVKVKFRGVKQALPWSINIRYNTRIPQNSDACVVNLTTSLSAKSVKMGETVRMTTTLTNNTKEGQPMTMAVLGIPAGLSPQPWQLKEMQEKGIFDFYEVRGNTVACYYRQMKPGEVRQINLDLKADIPGTFDAPASTAYLYYTAEHKVWQAGGVITITQP